MRFGSGSSVKLVSFLLLISLGLAAPASAAIISTTYKGTVSTGVDTPGVFGTAGANLAGDEYKLVYTIDTGVGHYSTFNGTISDPALSGDQVFGGMSAVITINGVDYVFNGPAASSSNYDIVAHKPGLATAVQQIGAAAGYVFASFQSTPPGPDFPLSVLSDASLTSCPGPTCLSSLNFAIDRGGSDLVAFLNFGSFASSVTAAAPLPATLPLLVSALGGLGFIASRRKDASAS